MLSKHRRTMSQHSSSTTSQGIYSILPLVTGLIPGAGDMVSSPTALSSRVGTGSVESIKEEEETPPTSLDVPEPEQKRRSFIWRLRRK